MGNMLTAKVPFADGLIIEIILQKVFVYTYLPLFFHTSHVSISYKYNLFTQNKGKINLLISFCTGNCSPK